MSIKILQTGDVHLGAKFEGLGERGALHRKQLEKVFERIIQVAIDKKADLFLVAGDLFDSDNPSQSAVDFIKRQLDKLSKEKINTVIIPGNHDFLSERSVYRKSFWNNLPDVFVFNNPDVNKKEFFELDAAVYAKVLTTKNSTESAILNVSPSNIKYTLNYEVPDDSPPAGGQMASRNSKYNIMIAHGSFIASERARELFFDQWPITADEIKNSGMNYIALGNFHGLQDVSQENVKAWYAGSPEALAFDQKNSGNILFIEIGDKGVNIEPIKVGERKFDWKEIIVDSIADSGELKNIILEGADINLVRKIILSGFSRPDLFIDEESLENELSDHFFKLIIINKSAPNLADIDSGKYSKDLIIGQFISLAKERINKAESEAEKNIIQKVLQLGLSELEK